MAKELPKNQELEKQHRRLFGALPDYLRPEEDSLEQPYPGGDLMETMTTYSVHGESPEDE